MIGYVLFLIAFSLIVCAVLLGVGYGVILLATRRLSLAGFSFIGAGLVAWACRRQYVLDAEIEALLGVGRWDSAFAPLCLCGVVLVAAALWAGLSGRIETGDPRPAAL